MAIILLATPLCAGDKATKETIAYVQKLQTDAGSFKSHESKGDIKVLEESGLLPRLPAGVGSLGDLAYVGIDKLHPEGLGASPRRKPRGKDRPPEDIAYNRAFSRRRIVVEHSIGRMRRYQSLSQTDRNHRQHHSARVRAVAGLVNRRIDRHCPC